MCAVNITPGQLYPPGKEHKCSLNGESGGPLSPSARLGEEKKIFCGLSGFELRTVQTVAWTGRSTVL